MPRLSFLSTEIIICLFLLCLCRSSVAFTSPVVPSFVSTRPSRSTIPFARVSTRIWALADDEDDDDDEDEEDDDEDNPLAMGIDSVSWLPTVVGAKGPTGEAPTGTDAEVFPLFPLGGIVYTPNSEHILNIFEPRYRQMYSDILLNGSKKFVVSMSHPTEQGRFAQTGVLFELEDLKEVSEQTGDKIKYICNHKVTGRVKLNRILNPEDWETRSTYLRVEGIATDDSGKMDNMDEPVSDDVYGAVAAAANGNPKEEKLLRDAFADMVDLQHDLEEDVRFTRASVATLAVKPGAGPDGLWQTIRLWQSFADQRLMARQNELQRDFQEKLQEFLKKEKGMKEDELPRYVRTRVNSYGSIRLLTYSSAPLAFKIFRPRCSKKLRNSRNVWL